MSEYQPKVSAIMPTRDRLCFAVWALECFQSQTYENRELVVLDDSAEPSFPGRLDGIPGVIYARDKSRNIAEKRNRCCEIATGEIIIHFDSDDWSAPTRMADQVERLRETKTGLTGYHTALFYDTGTKLAFRYHGSSNYAIGSSLAYTRDFWMSAPFQEAHRLGSDNRIVREATERKTLSSADSRGLLVARIHHNNSNRKNIGRPYLLASLNDLPGGFHQ
jgi:glycosyltransferase involved in cell wall biosynthesis